jgi:hypothetical protein
VAKKAEGDQRSQPVIKLYDIETTVSENGTQRSWTGAGWSQTNTIYQLTLVQKKRSKPLAEVHVVSSAGPELPPEGTEELWVRPNYTLRQQRQKPSQGNITPESGQRLLELADIALGLKKPSAAKRKSKALSAEAHHQRMQHKKKKPQKPA